jgi:hypothetical protein
LGAIDERINALAERVSNIEQILSGQSEVAESTQRSLDAQSALDARLQAVEKNSTAWSSWLADLPERHRDETTYRARTQAASTDQVSSNDVARETMNKVNARHR